MNDDLLKRGLEALSLPADGPLFSGLSRYGAAIEDWNPAYGLVGAEGDELVVKHLLDSLAPLAEIRAHLAVDLDAAVALSQAVLGDMMLAGYGRLVAVGSLAARTGVAGGVAYATAKAGLEGLMRGIALDYGRRGITANVVAVSFAETERLTGRIAGDAAHRERLERATALRRLPTPDEIADPIVFLCSPRAAAITGAVLDATAGAHLNTHW